MQSVHSISGPAMASALSVAAENISKTDTSFHALHIQQDGMKLTVIRNARAATSPMNLIVIPILRLLLKNMGRTNGTLFIGDTLE